MAHADHIPAEIEREMTPAVRAFFEAQRRAWQRRVEELEARVSELERELKTLRKFQRPEPPSAETAIEPIEPARPSDITPSTAKKKKRGNTSAV